MKGLCLALAVMAFASPAPAEAPEARSAKATFAGGGFWCMESELEPLPGVVSVVSGYTGGDKEGPTYHEASAGATGHAGTGHDDIKT